MSTDDSQLWMCVASGRTGELKWAQPLSPVYGSALGSVQPTTYFRTASLELDAADLNADGVRDFVVPAIRKDGTLETRAASGRDGSQLWQRDRREYGQSNQGLENYTSASFCDFEGDGQPEVILVEPIDANANPLEVGVVALDSNGRELWAKSTGSHYTNLRGLSTRAGQCLRPAFVHSPSGSEPTAKRTSHIVLQVPVDGIVTFDTVGSRMNRAFEFSTAKALGVFTCDMDHDGQEELLFMQGDTLFAIRADKLDSVIWQKKLPTVFQNEIRALLPKSSEFPPLLIVQTDATQNRLLGINVETGEEVWNCPGPIGRNADLSSYSPPNDIVMLGGNPDEPPLVCFQFDSISESRHAFLSKPINEASNRQSRFELVSISRAPAVTNGLKNDPRWKRPLPWTVSFAMNVNNYSYVAWGIFFSLTLLISPMSYLGFMIARRRYQLSYLLLLPVVVALSLQSVMITGPDDYEFSTLIGRFSVAVFFAPVIVGLVLLFVWTVSRKWRKLLAWLSVLFTVSIAIAIFSLVVSIRTSPLSVEESFDWQGWYLILIPVAYFLSWLMLAVTLLEMIVKQFTRRVQARKLGRSLSNRGRLGLDASGVATIVHPVQEPKPQ